MAIEPPRTFASQVQHSLNKLGAGASHGDAYARIVHSSGSSNPVVSAFNRVAGTASRVLAPAGYALSAYSIYSAESGQRGHVAAGELGAMAGGAAGGMFASGVVGAVGIGIGVAAAAAGIAVASPVITGVFLVSVAAGLAGSIAGAHYGREAGFYYYDAIGVK